MNAEVAPEDELYQVIESLHDEPSEEVDERWLISYADMMTLLFGLFVMLYAMVDNLNVVQEAAKKEFSAPTTKAEDQKIDPPSGDIKSEQLEFLREERAALVIKSASLEEQLIALRKHAAELERSASQNEELKDQLERQAAALARANIERREQAEYSAMVARREAETAEQAAEVLPPAQKNPPVAIDEKKTGAQYESGNIAGGASGIGLAGGKHQKTLKLVTILNSGRSFEAKTLKITLAGVQIDTTFPSELVGRNFNANLVRDDGSTIDVVMLGVGGPHGEPTSRLVIVDLSNGAETTLKTWINNTK